MLSRFGAAASTPGADRRATRNVMSCTGCGFEAPVDFAFCPKCGTKLALTCAACGAPTAPDFVFCARCGGPLRGTRAASPATQMQETAVPSANQAPDADYADRRPVTVLFADLTGFTTLSERLDPEDVRALQSELYEELRAALTR